MFFEILLLIIHLFFLITTVITKTFNPIAELAFLTDIEMAEANADIETQPVKVEV